MHPSRHCEEKEMTMADDTSKCPKCGHENPASSEDCDNCGISFDVFQMEKEKLETERSDAAQKIDKAAQTGSLTTCPSCGQATDFSAGDCLSCGIVFLKYFKIQEKALEDDPEKLQTLKNLKEAHEKAVALRLEGEEKEKAERLTREKIEREKAEELKKQKAEQAALEEIKNQQIEKEKQELLKKQEEEFNRQQAAKLQQIEKEKQAALDKQQEALKKAAALELQKALDKQKKAHEKAVAEQRQQAEKERQEALRKQKEDLETNQSSDRIQALLKNFQPPSSIGDLIKKYEGQTVGINVEDPSTLTPVVLAKVGPDHFSVLKTDTGQLHSFPFTAVTSLAEGATGMTLGKGDAQKTVFLAVRIYQPGG